MKYVIKNGSVVFPDGVKKCDVLVEDGKIAALGDIPCDIDAIDAEGMHVSPASSICTCICASPGLKGRKI